MSHSFHVVRVIVDVRRLDCMAYGVLMDGLRIVRSKTMDHETCMDDDDSFLVVVNMRMTSNPMTLSLD